MRADKRKRLEAKGWKVGSPGEFLNLSDEEAAHIVPSFIAYILVDTLEVNDVQNRHTQTSAMG
jgi:hypothetical protein